MNTRRKSSWRVVLIAVWLVIVALCVISAGGVYVVARLFRPAKPAERTVTVGENQRTGLLTLAYSPEKSELLQPLIAAFNRQKLRSDDGELLRISGVAVAPGKMSSGILAGSWQAVSPDSSLWLGIFDRDWQGKKKTESRIVGESFRYAVTPVVLAMWEDVARGFGWPEKAIGWQTVQRRAETDPDFRWGHPNSSQDASGMLATLAEFYAGAGVTRGLTKAQATTPETLAYVAKIEHSITFYGEGENALLQQALTRGPDFLDAFVTSEQMVIAYNRQKPQGPHLVAIYPAEGTLWLDHPLALLEQPDLTDNQRRTFQAFKAFLTTTENQKRVLAAGYRPADLSLPLTTPDTPWGQAKWVDALQPQTTLQIPPPSVIEVVRNAWFYTKRQSNIFLVVDSSGSMKGEKMTHTKAALRSFLDQMPPGQRVGFVQFASKIVTVEPLAPLQENKPTLLDDIDAMRATGKTALLDGIDVALGRLQRQSDADRINAIVVMTDGRENNSQTSLRTLLAHIQEGERQGHKVIIFAVAFGDDADFDTLRQITEATGGQVREGNTETIEELYQILSTYF